LNSPQELESLLHLYPDALQKLLRLNFKTTSDLFNFVDEFAVTREHMAGMGRFATPLVNIGLDPLNALNVAKSLHATGLLLL
jgi:hypothetical protein